jgi:hypothetical protein
MGETPQEQAELATAWQGWYEALGDSITDPGAPFGPATTLLGDGSRLQDGVSGLTGYVAITATDLDAATEQARRCPVLRQGGRVETYEVLEFG